MKKILFFLILTTSLFSQIEWEKDFATAQKRAKEEKKLILVFMERIDPPCRWCQKMKNETLKDKKIQNIINRYFIPVKVIKEIKNYPSFLKSKFVPTIFYLTKETKLIGKTVGYWDTKDFQSDLEYVLKRAKKE